MTHSGATSGEGSSHVRYLALIGLRVELSRLDLTFDQKFLVFRLAKWRRNFPLFQSRFTGLLRDLL